MKKFWILLCTLTLVLGLVPITVHAMTITQGDILRVDFDLTGVWNPATEPPLKGLYIALSGDTPGMDQGEGYTIDVYEGSDGMRLDDGIGFLVIRDIIGSYDLSQVWVKGVTAYNPNVSTDYVYPTFDFWPAPPAEGPPDPSTALVTKSFISSGGVVWSGQDYPLPEVPIPSAIWMLGSGLIGLVGFRKKFREA